MEASVWTWSTMITWAFSFHCTTSDDNCTNHFTPNQVARMHCYLDLVYQKWLMDRQPAPIPLAPIVTDQSPDSVSIYWLPPIRGPLYERYDYTLWKMMWWRLTSWLSELTKITWTINNWPVCNDGLWDSQHNWLYLKHLAKEGCISSPDLEPLKGSRPRWHILTYSGPAVTVASK